MSEQVPVWMCERVVSACSNGVPEPLEPFITEVMAQALAHELRRRIGDAVDEGTLVEVDGHLEGGRWLAAIGVEASLCVRAGIRVPFGIVDFQAVVGCDVHDAILDDLECVTDCKFLDPEENTGQI